MLKLQKRIENGKMFFVILDYSQGCIKDMFYFSNENQFPILEDKIFEIMSNDLEIEFKNKNYSRRLFQISLLATYRISIENDEINFKNSMFCNEFYNYVKFDRLTTLISYLKGKKTLEGLNLCREFILNETTLNSITSRGLALYEKTKELVASNDKHDKLFKEFLLLAVEDEYRMMFLKIQQENELAAKVE